MALSRNQVVNLITSIGSRQGLSPAQIRAMIATATVESGLDPSAVGDNGTSFGLFQHHIGGAGGPSRASAIRYHDPVTSITERAKWFKRNGIRSGAGAAALQRPADPSGYARKVDAALRGVKVGLNAPVEGTGGASGPAPTVSGKPVSVGTNPAAAALYERVFANNPTMLSLFRAKQAKDAAAAAAVPDAPEPAEPTTTTTGGSATTTPTGVGPLTSIDKVPRKPGEPGWRYLQRLGNTLFGLKNDPGSSQTTGGRHSANSHHYRGAAIDFGNARNSEAQLSQWHRFLEANRKQLGIVELLNEGDHRHAAIRR